MNKAELSAKLADKLEVTKVKGSEIIDVFVEIVKNAVKTGEKVSLMGFGSWEAKQKAARVGRNPQTGKEIKIKLTNGIIDEALINGFPLNVIEEVSGHIVTISSAGNEELEK